MHTRVWKHGTMVPAAGIALLPKAFCPLCWPAYAAGLSALGIGFVPLTTAYLLPLTTVVLFLGVSVLRVGAEHLGERWPVAVAMASALLILIGKFGAESSVLLSSGVVGFTVATAWNAWRTAQDARRGCCTTPQTLAVSFHRSQHGSTDETAKNRDF